MKRVVKEVTFDWSVSLGDTIQEKYESLYVFLREQEKLLLADKGQLTIQAAETICSVFESCVSSWAWDNRKVVPFYVNGGTLQYKGKVNVRWALWLDPFMSDEELLFYNDEGVIRIFTENLFV